MKRRCSTCRHQLELVMWNYANPWNLYLPDYDSRTWCCDAQAGKGRIYGHADPDHDGACEYYEEDDNGGADQTK